MGTIIGAILGAMLIMGMGRLLKGRDFIGLAVAMMILAWIVGAFVIGPAMIVAEVQMEANGTEANEAALATATSITSGLVTALVAFVPGALIVLMAKSAKTPKG